MVEFGKLTPPSPSRALPPQDYLEAVPKYISGRTSYFRVRLAFHPYPQLIPAFCTRHGFGPPPRCYRGFNLAMGSSPGFGSNPDNIPDMMETLPLVSVFRDTLTLPKVDRRDSSDVRQKFRLRPVAPYSDSLSLWLRNCYSLTELPKLTRRLILQ